MNIDLPHSRTWEFLFRAADILWSRLGDRPEVYERRCEFFSTTVRIIACSEYESNRFKGDFEQICHWVASKWCELYDQWQQSRDGFIFEDGYAVLFFTRVLHANNVVLARGHYDQQWTLTPSLERIESPDSRMKEEELSREFMTAFRNSSMAKTIYPFEIPPGHEKAILQHYGFPTDLLDFSYSLDVALFFAEGGTDHLPVADKKVECGALYIVPSFAITNHAVLTTLPQGIMRPCLQRGVYAGGVSKERRKFLDAYKYVFRHQSMPVWNGLGDIPFGSSIGLGRYLLPTSDPIWKMALSVRERVTIS